MALDSADTLVDEDVGCLQIVFVLFENVGRFHWLFPFHNCCISLKEWEDSPLAASSTLPDSSRKLTVNDSGNNSTVFFKRAPMRFLLKYCRAKRLIPLPNVLLPFFRMTISQGGGVNLILLSIPPGLSFRGLP